jgi:hypothetical protein
MIMFAANLTLIAITYMLFGIPLFLESRLAQFEGSGGVGVQLLAAIEHAER